MRLTCVYARFYKSFNFDAVRKSHPKAKAKPWETIDGDFYPYVEIPIDRRITTVVGANESGKSHLLSAIRKAVTCEGFEQKDLCRYSPFFNVERGRTAWPHLGLAWTDVSADEAEAVRAAAPDAPARLTSFTMFREGPDRLRLFFPQGAAGQPMRETVLEGAAARAFGRSFLPLPFEIRAGVGLPASVPLAWLRDEIPETSALASRRSRGSLLEAGAYVLDNLPADAQQLANVAASWFPTFSSLRSARAAQGQRDHDPDALRLARDLLVRLALVDPERLSDLADAIADGDDGHANALVARINAQLAKHLNFPRFWAQDRDFSLRITPREIDLVFTIQDRTGTEYTFAERSHGLKYFLSYLIQAQTREPAQDRSEILLMDEPDAFLSAEAQQDLLKIFDAFAEPEAGRRPVQVVYVTHSPFLLDKNHAERIRVLQKGKGAEGTRVVKNASRNHYEPLRSAFGAFVGETAFIGACNLLVEGAADQILLAGSSRLIRARDEAARNDSLDLNRLVVVPCGSASQVPYMVYVIRGRDTEKPPVIALLDADGAGRDAVAALRGGDRRMARLIRPEHVVGIAEAVPDAGGRAPIEIEDLIPPALAVRAANAYFAEVAEFREVAPLALKRDQLPDPLPGNRSIFAVLDGLAAAGGLHIDKVGFARAVIQLCEEDAAAEGGDPDVAALLARMAALFKVLGERQRSAERDAARVRIGALVDRQQANFLRDHGEGATREQARNFLEGVLDVLDDTRESDAIRTRTLELRRDFGLDDEPRAQVDRYDDFARIVRGLKHSFEEPPAEPARPEATDGGEPAARRRTKTEPRANGGSAPAAAKGKPRRPTARKRQGVGSSVADDAA